MVERVEISTARGRLKELTSRAAMGEEIILTRYNKDVARIVGLEPRVAPRAPSSAEVSSGEVDFGPVDSPQQRRDAILNKITTRKRS